MNTNTIEQPLNALAAQRSRIYALLAEVLSFPSEDSALRLLNGDWAGEYLDATKILDYFESQSEDTLLQQHYASVSELQSAYSTLFDVASGTPKVSLLERRYGDTPEQTLWRELLGFYSHFGLDFSEGYAEEQIDHLLTELSFMHYLSFLEAGAETGAIDFQRGQKDFLQLHLLPFIESFHGAIIEHQETGFYGSLASDMLQFARADLVHLQSNLEESSD